jgi:hypothetical protein
LITAKQAEKACILAQYLSRRWQMEIFMSQVNLKEMSQKELRAYISEHHNNDENVRAAIAESSSRDGWIDIPADMPLDEQERIFTETLNRFNAPSTED